MNEFNDFSIQDEYDNYDQYLENYYDEDQIMQAELPDSPDLKVLNMEDDLYNSVPNMASNASPVRKCFKAPIAAANSIGAQFFKNFTGDKSFSFFNKKFCRVGDNFDFSFPNITREASPNREKPEQFLNCINSINNLGYRNLNSQRSFLSNKGDSRNTSFTKSPSMEDLMEFDRSELSDSMVRPKVADKNATNSDTRSEAPKVPVSTNSRKLRIPKMSDFSLYPTFTAKFASRTQEDNLNSGCRYKIKSGLENSDFNFNAAYIKEVAPSEDRTTKSRSSIISENIINSKSTLNEPTQGPGSEVFGTQDGQSTEDDFLVGPLTKKQREAKVKKYLEKKKKRQWEKKVNYESRKKVADTRPRYKGRFVSFEQAEELLDEYKKDLDKKLEKERVFVTKIFSRKTGELRKIIYPTEEALRRYSTNNLI